MQQYRVLVAGDDGINSLGIVRSLGEYGYFPDALITSDGKKPIHLLKSKYLNNGIIVNKNSQEICSALLSYGDPDKKCFLFPTSDYVLSVIGKNKEALSEYYYLPSVAEEIGSLVDVLSKERMAHYAEQAGFIVPKMKKVYVDADGVFPLEVFDYFSDEYPLILKSDSILLPGCDFKVVKNEKELKDFLSTCTEKIVLLQKYIANAEEIAVQCVGFGNKRPAEAFGVIHKIRTSVFALGTTTYAELRKFDDQELKKKCIRFADILSYSGIYDLDILLKDSHAYFIECNFRNGSNGYAYTKAGANLPVVWIESLVGSLESSHKETAISNTVFVNDVGDFAHFLAHRVRLRSWIYQYMKSDCRLLFDFNDQRPFWSEVGYYTKAKIMAKKG